MVEDHEAIDVVFHALAHPARRDMLGQLANGDLTVGELAAPLTMSLAAASKHVQTLERAGLLQRTILGRRHVCRLNAAPLAGLEAWVRFYKRHWTGRLDALAALVEDDKPNKDEE